MSVSFMFRHDPKIGAKELGKIEKGGLVLNFIDKKLP